MERGCCSSPPAVNGPDDSVSSGPEEDTDAVVTEPSEDATTPDEVPEEETTE